MLLDHNIGDMISQAYKHDISSAYYHKIRIRLDSVLISRR
jgi:hypothetical protein